MENPSYDELPELEEGTRYYWLVNEVWADGTVITGDVWNFTTGKLVGCWKFDETEGRNAGDSSSNNNVGKLIGNAQWQPSAGKIGGALEFDGINGYVDCGNDPSLDITGQITVATWVKTNDAGNSQFHPYITKGLAEMPELRWIPALGATSHRVYGGVEPDELQLLGETTEPRFSKLPNIHTNMVYYWRVDGILADSSIVKGDVWSFRTLPEISATNPNLVGWWKFDGNANDSSGHGNNGTEKGDPTYTAGKIGQAISFDGRGDRIEVQATFAGNPELFPAKAISVSAWVRTTVPASALCSLVRHEFHFTPLQTFADCAWATAFVNRYGSRTLRRTDFDWSKINDDKWHYFAVTYNNGIHEVWIDGAKEVSRKYGSFPLWTRDDQPWVFGGKERGEGGGEYYPGELDDVRIYNCALNRSEIIALYNEGK